MTSTLTVIGLVTHLKQSSHTTFGDAIYREKQLKGWLRSKKIALIEEHNPGWDDLSLSWAFQTDPSLRSG